MRIGLPGGGPVGQTLGAAFARLGHEVALGIREVTAETLAQPRAQARPLRDWQAESGARVVTMAEAATGEHDLFLCGNDPEAKEVVRGLAKDFGWGRVVDLGDLAGARAQEAFVVIWVRLWMTQGTPMIGYRIAGL